MPCPCFQYSVPLPLYLCIYTVERIIKKIKIKKKLGVVFSLEKSLNP